MSGSHLDPLHQSIHRRANLVLSLQAGRDLFHYRSRMLAHEQRGFWVAAVPQEQSRVQRLIESGQPIGVSFENEQGHRMLAIGRILQRGRVDCDGESIDALLLEYPRALEHAQRRSEYRVPVPAQSSLWVRAWVQCDPTAREQTSAEQELRVEVRDLSVGGIGAVFRTPGGEPASLREGDRVRLDLRMGNVHAELTGRARHVSSVAGILVSGLEFELAAESQESEQLRLVLRRIVNQIQRGECRRQRVTLFRRSA